MNRETEAGYEVQGRCHCGAITYEAEVEPGTVNVCRCLGQPLLTVEQRLLHSGVARGAQCAVKPPSTGRATPSTKLAPGLQSQRTAAAISSDFPSRPIGCCFMISAMASF